LNGKARGGGDLKGKISKVGILASASLGAKEKVNTRLPN